jgi:16S rRNA (guanine527-N7)-methyltransferase
MSVSRETVDLVVAKFDVPDPASTADTIVRVLEALEAEPGPPTTVREASAALDTHIADSLSGLAVPGLRNAERIADLGAGAGFPGLALAAALPATRVDLVESTRRKCDVIERLAARAGLQARVSALAIRAEDLARGEGRGSYDAVTARALAPLPVICEYAAPLLRMGGVLVAWKGAPQPDEEAAGRGAAAALGLELAEIVKTAPYAGSERRHLYVYSKVMDTPSEYPRRTGLARKKPLV